MTFFVRKLTRQWVTVLLVLFAGLTAQAATRDLRVYFIDVEGGQSTLL